jgi:CRISPR-associated protein Cas6
MAVDLVFSVRGDILPGDHAYALYGALSRIVPKIHEPDSGIRFKPVNGLKADPGRIALSDVSRLRIRLSETRIADALPLSGKLLDVDGYRIRLGVPSVVPLNPSPSLFASLVTFKNADNPDPFLDSARQKLAELGVEAIPSIPLHRDGDRRGQPRRRVIRIKGKAIVGYSLILEGLTADHSLKMQESPLGGRTQMGCGFFLPLKGGK